MNDPFQRGQFRLPRREIAYLRFLAEGYDGLLFVRTLEASSGLVEVAWPASRAAEAAALLAALGTEIGLTALSGAPPAGDEF